MKIKNILRIAAIILLSASLCSCGNGDTLRMGTGNVGGHYYNYGNVLREYAGDVLDVKRTAGSQANMRLLNEGFVDVAIVQSDVLSEAVNGTGDFSGEPVSDVRAVAGLYSEAFQLVVRSDSDIYELADLKGKKMSVGEEGSGVAKNAEYLFRSAGVDISDTETVYMSYAESAAALEKGDIDAFFLIVGAPAAVVSELAESTDVRFVAPDSTAIKYMTSLYKGYSQVTVPAGTYRGQNEDLVTVGVKAVLAADASASREDIRELTAAIFENSDKIKYSVTVSEPDPQFAVTDIPCSFHEGAAEYYQSIGISVNTDPAAESASFVFGAQDN